MVLGLCESVPGACFCSPSHPTASSCGLVLGLPKQTLLQKHRVVGDVPKLPFSAEVFTACIHLPSPDPTEYEWSQLRLQSHTCLFPISTEQGLGVGDLHRPILLRICSQGCILIPMRLLWALTGVGRAACPDSGGWAGHLYSAVCTESLWRTTAGLAFVQYKESKS